MMEPWFPNKKWRTETWHIRNEEHNQEGYVFFYYQPQYDEIGVDTGHGSIVQCESWPSFRHSQSGERMPEQDALKRLSEIETECDAAYKRNEYYLSFMEIGEDFHNARPYREHPVLLAKDAITLERDTTARRPFQFKTAATKTVATETPRPPPQDDTTWRTQAFFVANTGFRPYKYTTFCELRSHPDRDKDRQGLMLFVTWRMGEHSVYRHEDETGFQSAMERMRYFEFEHRECTPASTVQTGPLALPREYSKAEDYHAHPLFNSGDLVIHRNIAPLKAFRFKS